MPSSPSEVEMKNPRRVLFDVSGIPDSSAAPETANELPKRVKFHSQPMPKGFVFEGAFNHTNFTHHPSIARLKDKRFDSFKTWSGKLERQLSNLRGRPREAAPENNTPRRAEMETNLPVDRYFDALQGPELDTLRVCVVIFQLFILMCLTIFINDIITISTFTAFRGDSAS